MEISRKTFWYDQIIQAKSNTRIQRSWAEAYGKAVNLWETKGIYYLNLIF